MYYNQKSVGDVPLPEKDLYADESLIIGRISEPLSRAFIVYNMADEKIYEFMNEINPIVDDNNNFIKTKSYKFPLSSAKIEKYEPRMYLLELIQRRILLSPFRFIPPILACKD